MDRIFYFRLVLRIKARDRFWTRAALRQRTLQSTATIKNKKGRVVLEINASQAFDLPLLAKLFRL